MVFSDTFLNEEEEKIDFQWKGQLRGRRLSNSWRSRHQKCANSLLAFLMAPDFQEMKGKIDYKIGREAVGEWEWPPSNAMNNDALIDPDLRGRCKRDKKKRKNWEGKSWRTSPGGLGGVIWWNNVSCQYTATNCRAAGIGRQIKMIEKGKR